MISQRGRDAGLAVLDLLSTDSATMKAGGHALLDAVRPTTLDGGATWDLTALLEGIRAPMWALIHRLAAQYEVEVADVLEALREDINDQALPRDLGELAEVWDDELS